MSACDDCLRRAWLLGRTAGYLEVARHDRRRLHDVLALPDHAFIAALCGRQAAAIRAEWRKADPQTLREAAAAAQLVSACPHRGGYPAALSGVPGAPAALFFGGDPAHMLPAGEDERPPPAVAIVGARRATPDGLEVARTLGRGLAAAGVTVVSGMALGIDAAAHAGALEGGGTTIAVLAGGADRPYPAAKRHLHRAIRRSGAIVSEMPPGATPYRWAFPARNRIIAGLVSLTVVVEAAERSGSLITADFATQLGREVAAVPGSVLAMQSRGSNALLRDGALLVRDAQDVLDALFDAGCSARPPDRAQDSKLDPAAGLERRLRELLDDVARGDDTLAALVRPPRRLQPVMAGLAELELLGLLRRDPGGRYGRVLG